MPDRASADQPGLFDRDGSTDTQRAAAAAIEPRSGTRRMAVLQVIRRAGAYGITDWELESALAMLQDGRRWTYGDFAPRRRELVSMGHVVATTARRRSPESNDEMIVWKAADHALPHEVEEQAPKPVPAEAPPEDFPGLTMLQQERIGQVMREGFTPAHDVQHRGQELAWAAWCYLNRASSPLDDVAFDPTPPVMWPPDWSVDLWKPGPTRVRMLVKAGALIAAEIDRRLAQGEM